MTHDLIGDIHGYAGTLKALLERLGYVAEDGVHRHPSRTAVFLGDFIDRGPGQREVIDLVLPMVESGSALAVMGNHEFNALAWATPDPDGPGYLRTHSDENERQHRAFLEAFPPGSADHAEVLAWFRSLPLWLDLEGIRVVHACWDPDAIALLSARTGPEHCLTDELLVRACDAGSPVFEAVETLLKGKEVELPEGASFRDKEGTERHRIRIRWWDTEASTHREAFLGPESAATHIPEDPIGREHLITYAQAEKPCFLGHYWLEGTPEPLAPNIACLDYSVAKPGGKLAAYRWDGEAALDASRFVTVPQADA